jgi:hypothetical protein
VTRRRWWLYSSYGSALLFAVTLGYFLLRIPIQVTDSFTTVLALADSAETLIRSSVQDGYLRPAMWLELKLVYELSRGAYFDWFRWTQVVQTALVLASFVWLIRPRTRIDALVLPLALAVLVGHHTFAWTLREAFPINTYLTIVLCCAAAANLAFAPHRWWIDVCAVALFVVAAATVESGLLVGGIFIVGYLLGLRGVSRRGLAVVLALIAAYFVIRFGVLRVGMPGLLARDAGFLFQRYDAADLERLVAGRVTIFYLYNVAASMIGLLLAEPRDGVLALTRSVLAGSVNVPLLIGFVSSTLATALIARYAWRRRSAWRRWQLDRHDQIVLLFIGVLAGNACISYAYTKDTIMSPAGFLYAAAFFVACHGLVVDVSRARAGVAQAPASWRGRLVHASGVGLVFVLSVTWSIRAVGLHAGLAYNAFKVREQWAYVDEMIAGIGYVPVPPRVAALKTVLQNDAVIVHPAKPELREQFLTLFEVD